MSGQSSGSQPLSWSSAKAPPPDCHFMRSSGHGIRVFHTRVSPTLVANGLLQTQCHAQGKVWSEETRHVRVSHIAQSLLPFSIEKGRVRYALDTASTGRGVASASTTRKNTPCRRVPPRPFRHPFYLGMCVCALNGESGQCKLSFPSSATLVGTDTGSRQGTEETDR